MYYYMLSVSLDLMDHVQEAVGVLQEESSWPIGMKRKRMADMRCLQAHQLQLRCISDVSAASAGGVFFSEIYGGPVRALGDIGQAEHYLSEAIERYPDSYELYLKRAEVFNRSGNKMRLKRIWHGRLKRRRTITARISTWPGFIARMVWRIRPTS